MSIRIVRRGGGERASSVRAVVQKMCRRLRGLQKKKEKMCDGYPGLTSWASKACRPYRAGRRAHPRAGPRAASGHGLGDRGLRGNMRRYDDTDSTGRCEGGRIHVIWWDSKQGRSSVVEQWPFKPKVVGSIPTAPTISPVESVGLTRRQSLIS